MQQVCSYKIFLQRHSRLIFNFNVLLVQWLEYGVANGVAQVRFPDSACDEKNIFVQCASCGIRTHASEDTAT